MKAIVYVAPGKLQLMDVPEPEPRSSEVMIQVDCVGVCGSELAGFSQPNPMRVPPLIMGHEFTGTRLDTEEPVIVNPIVTCRNCDLCLRGSENLCRQRRIVGVHRDGAFAERVAVPKKNTYSKPDGLDPGIAALSEPVANAVHAFRLLQERNPLPRRVGIVGAGTLGLATALIASRRGVDVVLCDNAEPRRDLARTLGFARVEHRLEGEFDAVFDAVGHPDTRRDSVEHIRPGGTCIWIGLHDSDPGFDALDLVRTEKAVVGSFAYLDEDFREAISMVADIDGRWIRRRPLENGVEAFLELLEGVPRQVKTLIEMPSA